MTRQKPTILCILDGWGYRAAKKDNAIELGKTPVWHKLARTCPTCMVQTSGKDVGLPDGQMGNSEVGHMNLGAGRVVTQDLPRIDAAVESGELDKNPALLTLIKTLQANKRACHILGLLGTGGVHAQQSHVIALARIVSAAGIPVVIHGFLDGRDTPPDSAQGFVADLEKEIAAFPNVRIGTLGGRYYGMDRDNRWERVTKAYEAIVSADAPTFDTADKAIQSSYAHKVFDEFLIPCCIGDYHGMADGDAFIMANYRSDRAREITKMLAQPDFHTAERTRVVRFSDAVAMTEYSQDHAAFMHVLFPPHNLGNIFGQVISDAGLTQLRIAETEKYAHVTFFFNGGQETLFPGEDRILIPSPKVATYDLQPEMSAYEVTDKLVDAIMGERFDVIIVNYANGDMVGHTGILAAAIAAVEAVDTCLGRVAQAVRDVGGVMLVTADHGNAELMKDPQTDASYTAHTVGPVKAILVNGPKGVALADGRLADIAPTLLDLMGMEKPPEMTGRSLIKKKEK